MRRGPLRRLQDRLFAELLADEASKRRLIAFMDVALGIADATLIAELTRSYFPRGQMPLSGVVGALLKVGTLPGLPDRLVGAGFKTTVAVMLHRFLAGRDIEAALDTVERLHDQGLLSSVDVVRERVVSVQEADAYRDRVLTLMDQWVTSDEGPAATLGGVPVRHVSLKLSALTHRFDPMVHAQVRDDVGERLLTIFQRAKAHAEQDKPILINVDAEEYYGRALSTDIFWEVFADTSLAGWDDAGLVIQAYFKDAEPVLREHIKRAQASGKRPQLRLVKGAYHRYEQIVARRQGWEIPVFLKQAETDQNFQRLLEIALDHHGVFRLATGTHNLQDIAAVHELRESLNLGSETVELQFLLGVGDSLAADSAAGGIPTRIYSPFGTGVEAIAYLVRRLAEVGPDSAMARQTGSKVRRVLQHQTSPCHSTGRPAVWLGRTTRRPFDLAPEPDFSRHEVRDQMQRSIATALAASEGRVVRPMIGLVAGPARDAVGLSPILNPADIARPVGAVRFANESEVDEALAAAQDGFAEWSAFTPGDRAGLMQGAADLVIERQYEIAATIVLEAGKPWALALAETREAANFLRGYASDAMREAERYRPRGVGVGISPFNFPFAITMGQLAAGLALGNAMIAKPAEQTPLSGMLAVTLLRDAGIPHRAIQLLPGLGATVGQRLVASPMVDFVAFTGSQQTARLILETAAQQPPQRGGIKRVVAETGGKNALIIDETADLDVAVSAVLEGAFHYNGQRCSAVSRVIVDASLQERFLKRLIAGTQSLIIGDPCDPATQLGPQIDAAALDKAEHYIRLGEQEAELLYAADVSDWAQRGYYVGPHLFVNVPPDARLAQEEIFAPVLAVLTARSFAEALHIANNSSYALTAALISRHPQHIREFFARVAAGNKYVNRAPVGARPGETPFGGFKNSGTGPKAGGRDIVARFGVPIGKTRGGWRELPVGAQHAVPLPDHSEQARSLRDAQQRWTQTPLQKRYQLLAHVENLLSRREFKQANHIVRHLIKTADEYLLPHETIYLPGERNEVVYDQPLGVGYIWGEHESFSDMLAATLAALVMGNAVALPAEGHGPVILELCASAELPEGLVQLVSGALLDCDFVVAHGPDAVAVHRRFATGFCRFIGGGDDPAESRYLSYFAHSTTRTESTLRHGADLERL